MGGPWSHNKACTKAAPPSHAVCVVVVFYLFFLAFMCRNTQKPRKLYCVCILCGVNRVVDVNVAGSRFAPVKAAESGGPQGSIRVSGFKCGD